MFSVYAHRAAWILGNGKVPKDREIAHRCLNLDCCNPTHLMVATPAQRCGLQPGRGRSVAGVRHPGVKLTATQVRQLRALVAKHPELTGKEIAARFGLTTAWTNAIIRGEGWKTIPSRPLKRPKGPRPGPART